MPSNDRLTEFVTVVDVGSISGAARVLDVPRATLSRRMSALEAELGVRLLHRNTRRLVLTPAGQELVRRARRIVSDAAEAWSAVRRLDDVPRGLLRVSTTGTWLDDIIVGFLREFPEVQVEVRSTTRHVDLIAEGVDVALRMGEVRDPNLIVRKVTSGARVVVASSSYLGERGVPNTPYDLSEHDCIVGFAGEFAPQREWPLCDGGSVRVAGRVAANDIRMMRAAALGGLGLALLPRMAVVDDLARGALVVVLEDSVGADASASLVYADREYIDPKVRAFVDRAVLALKASFLGALAHP
jgi:DNA-binding transcriptional LysR family regulator